MVAKMLTFYVVGIFCLNEHYNSYYKCKTSCTYLNCKMQRVTQQKQEKS